MLAVDLIRASRFIRWVSLFGALWAVSLASTGRAQPQLPDDAQQAKHIAVTALRTPQEKKPQSALEACVAHAFVGARAAQPFRTEFFLPGDGRAHVDGFTRDDCRGYIAVGGRYVQALSLSLYDDAGRLVASAGDPGPVALVRHCGRAGERVTASVRALDGQGEVSYGVLERADVPASSLQELAHCPAVGTKRPPLADVGPEPAGPSIAQSLADLRSSLASLGYSPERLLGYGVLTRGRHETRGVHLEPGRCYALAATGSRAIVDLDLRVFDTGLTLEPIATDATRKRDAVVKLCSEEDGRYLIDVAVDQGEGAYAVQAFELNEPTPGLASLTGTARIAYAEMVARMRERGLRTEIVTSGAIDAGEGLRVPVSLGGGICHALGAISVDGTAGTGLELSLIDERGDLIAMDSARSADPLVFECPPQDASRRVVVRTKDARSASRFLLLRGQDPSSVELSTRP